MNYIAIFRNTQYDTAAVRRPFAATSNDDAERWALIEEQNMHNGVKLARIVELETGATVYRSCVSR